MDGWNIYKTFKKFDNLIAGTTTKELNKPYSYSLAIHTGEKVDLIELNRSDFVKKIPKNFKVISLNQVHGNKIIDVDKLHFNTIWFYKKIDADGMVTTKQNILLTILSADCLGILAYDYKKNIIGAAHAGWRGSYKNISKNLIDFMIKKGSNVEDILVTLSPCIKSCCYEVSKEVAQKFIKYNGAVVKKNEEKYNLDISYVNKLQLLEAGVLESNIEVSSICTSCSSDRYFSYRKEKCSGRFISFIGMI